jgi:hypothetical protein
MFKLPNLASVGTVLESRLRLASLLGSCVVVYLWTLFRHITNGVNFDVVGQIGLAQQWSQGLHSGAQLGTTNYVLKMPLYWLFNSFDFLSPMHRLLILALICNLATFILLFLLFEKFLGLFAVRDKKWLYLGMFWLACIAGNVFWTDYANSRNLETVGGVLFVYLILKFLQLPRVQTAILAIITGSVVFFADSLQLYVCGVGVCAYAIIRWIVLRQKTRAVQALHVIGITLASFIGAKLLFLGIGHWLRISFFTAPRQTVDYSLSGLFDITKGIVESTLDAFGANIFKQPFGANTVRELIGFIILMGIVFAIVRYRSTVRTRGLFAAGLLIIAVNYLIYLASGQVNVWATSRYLIMVPLFTILLLATIQPAKREAVPRKLWYGWLCLALISVVLLIGALVIKWPDRHAKDAHIFSTVKFLDGQPYALSSREFGVTTTYFSHGKTQVLPLLCTTDHRLVPTDLFYDKAGFEKFRNSTALTPVIVPAGGIVSDKSICSQQDVQAQFGPAITGFDVPDIGTVLVFPAQQLTAQLSPNLAE